MIDSKLYGNIIAISALTFYFIFPVLGFHWLLHSSYKEMSARQATISFDFPKDGNKNNAFGINIYHGIQTEL